MECTMVQKGKETIFQHFEISINFFNLCDKIALSCSHRSKFIWFCLGLKWVTKKTHLAVFETCFFAYISGTTWTKKMFLNLCLKSFQMKKKFKSGHKISWYLYAVLPEKSKLLEKIHHFERFKNLFSWI